MAVARRGLLLVQGVTMDRGREFERGLYAAMLADVSEALFGGNAKNAPTLLANAHAGWACGSIGKLEGETYVDMFFRLRSQEGDRKNWREFIMRQKMIKE